MIYWNKCLTFQADFKNGNLSGGRGSLGHLKLVFVLFSYRSRARSFVFKSHGWRHQCTELRLTSRRGEGDAVGSVSATLLRRAGMGPFGVALLEFNMCRPVARLPKL